MTTATVSRPLAAAPGFIESGTPAYRQVSLALFFAGFATFSLLYCVQPLLPQFARHFGLTPVSSSLALSLSTGALALAIFAAGALAQQLPRRELMFASMALAALCNLAAAAAQQWPVLLAIRLLEGLALGGVPAVAMAYLAEEVHPRHLGKAMGLYVAGTAFGGMMGRLGISLLAAWGSWRVAMAALGVLDLLLALGFAWLLPASRHFRARRGFVLSQHLRIWRGQMGHSGLIRLYAVSFSLMGAFVALYNYVGFRLSVAPYALSQTMISLIFLSYISGMFASPAAGHCADRFGRRWPLVGALLLMMAGIGLTVAQGLPFIVLGILLITMGFFAAHAIASGWVGRLAGEAKSHASALYLLFYYLGSSVMGSLGGWLWQHRGWNGVAGMTGALALLGLAMALSLHGEEGAHG